MHKSGEYARKFPIYWLFFLSLFLEQQKQNTVKLGFNELGYNEHSVITNEYFGPKSQFST